MHRLVDLVPVAGVTLAVAGLVALIATMLAAGERTDPVAVASGSTVSAAADQSVPGGTATSAGGPVSASASVATGASAGVSSDVPVGVPRVDGLAVTAAIVSPTTLEVVEILSWPEGGPSTIELGLPAEAAGVTGLTIETTPTVEALQVSVDGVPVVPVPRNGSSSRWLVTPPTSAASRSMEIRYLLGGAIVRSVPAVPGRALAVLVPIAYEAAGDLPVTIEISTTGVLNVYCPGRPSPTELMCGRLDGDHWTVGLPPGLLPVVAQLDLPELT